MNFMKLICENAVTEHSVTFYADYLCVSTKHLTRLTKETFKQTPHETHALGTAVHITTDEGMTWNQIYAVLASAMGAPLCAAYVASKFLAVCGRAAGYDFEGPLLGDKAANVRFDNTKIKRLVPDFAPRVSMAQGIRGAVEYLLAHPELQTPDPEFDTWCDRVLAAQSAAKAVFDGAHLA